jgi:O-antigen ligase
VTSERLVRIQRWYLRAGLFLLPLAYSWGTYDRYVLPKVMVARVLVLGLLILLAARALADRALALKRTSIDLPLLLFIASAVVSTMFAENQNAAIFGIYSRYDGLVTILTYAALFWLSIQAIDGPNEARAVFRFLLVSGYVVAAVAIVQAVNDSLRQETLVPAFGTLGQQNVLGAFLALLLPIAYNELVEAKGWSRRVLALNALVVLSLALLLTFSRSAWLGTAVAAVIVLTATQRSPARVGVVAAAALIVAGVALAGLSAAGGQQIVHSLQARAGTIFDPGAWAPRPAIWRDTLNLIAARPVLGFGPDNFGLVYPRFQATDFGLGVDKAHAETLQVAATQGLVGLAAYLYLLAAFVRAFWRGRRLEGAVLVFAGWAAYQVTLQLNFSALAAAFPFWVFAAAAIHSWGDPTVATPVAIRGRGWLAAGGAAIAVALGVTLVSTVLPYLADARLLDAVTADYSRNVDRAQVEAKAARSLWPIESVYAVEVGNTAFERGDWASARMAYGDAARLGTYNPLVYRNLALADRNLGLVSEAKEAARKAVELDRFDPANRALLAEFGGAP